MKLWLKEIIVEEKKQRNLKRKNKFMYFVNRGFIGLITLLIGVVVIIFILLRADIFTGNKDQGGVLNQGIDAIDKAKEVRDQVEMNNQKAYEYLE